jgi:hypothetical protein
MSTVDSSQGFEINKKLSFHIAVEFVRQSPKSISKYTVCPEQEEMDRVGVEPTTSTYF